jgi:predicted DNA-binding transcriptional regulator AlpA
VFYQFLPSLLFIGIGPSQAWEHIAAGRLPKPVAPCAGSSKRGYYGRTIKEIQAAALLAI